MANILVVEDDPTILETVAYNLRREGHTVTTASDGASGLRAAREEGVDLIVLDLMLPRMSGMDISRIVRAERSVPIIMLTARDEETDKIVGLEAGADDYVTKPFSMRELIARVSAQLRRDRLSREAVEHEQEGGTELRAGAIVLDAVAHEVRLDGHALAIRPKEFDLLEYLMRHPGQALTREQILESVWGYSYAGETRTVDVHIRWLREKLEAEPAHPQHITTVRGLGYKFVS
ncbi:MAG: DNA-binding response regulator [Chloroflexi bacterium]|nr:MAG: DNA-binding response regulator [Chloroflexota bacterium]